jgi:AraC family transcriptional regulator
MIRYRIEEKPAFQVVGKKRLICAQDGNEAFGDFWRQAHEDGVIDALRRLGGDAPGAVTESYVMGISRVEQDPTNRDFDFYIATEASSACGVPSLESFRMPAARWAIFENEGPLPGSLVEAEMFAFFEWLPSSGFEHAHAPELEVYPARKVGAVEFWLPIAKRA